MGRSGMFLLCNFGSLYSRGIVASEVFSPKLASFVTLLVSSKLLTNLLTSLIVDAVGFEHHRDTLLKNILKTLNKLWDYAHVLYHINRCHKCIFLEYLYINLKTKTINDKSANFPATYHIVLKHE